MKICAFKLSALDLALLKFIYSFLNFQFSFVSGDCVK